MTRCISRNRPSRTAWTGMCWSAMVEKTRSYTAPSMGRRSRPLLTYSRGGPGTVGDLLHQGEGFLFGVAQQAAVGLEQARRDAPQQIGEVPRQQVGEEISRAHTEVSPR